MTDVATGLPSSATGPLTPPWGDLEGLGRFADLTLAEFFRQLARYGPGARIEEQDGLVLCAGAHAHPNPYRNAVIRLDRGLDPHTTLERAEAFFSRLNRSCVLWVREGNDDLDELCRSRGLELIEPEGLPEMVLEGWPTPIPELAEGVVLQRADDPEVRRDYVDVVAEGWGMRGVTNELASAIFFDPDSVADPHVIAFVAYVDGKPASGSMALLTNGIAVGGQGATVPWARRRGLAEACYAACLDVAYSQFAIRGSVCQSSPSGLGVWERMGYRQFSRYFRYLIRPAAPNWG